MSATKIVVYKYKEENKDTHLTNQILKNNVSFHKVFATLLDGRTAFRDLLFD